MATQLADGMNRKSSDAVIMEITPTPLGRRQQSQNALRKADFSAASQEFGLQQDQPRKVQRSRDGSHDAATKLSHTYGYNQTLRLEPKRSRRTRPESGQVKINSNDPRLQALGQIYLQA